MPKINWGPRILRNLSIDCEPMTFKQIQRAACFKELGGDEIEFSASLESLVADGTILKEPAKNGRYMINPEVYSG